MKMLLAEMDSRGSKKASNKVNKTDSNRHNNRVNNLVSNPDGNKASSKVNSRDNRVDSKADRQDNKLDNSKAVRRMVVPKMDLATHDSTLDQRGDRKGTVGATIVKSDPSGANDSVKQKIFVESGAVAPQPELLVSWTK